MYAGVPSTEPVAVRPESPLGCEPAPSSSVVSSATTARVLDAAREPEVGDDDPAVAPAQHVVRLEVAMHEPRGVRGREPATRGAERVDDVGDVARLATSAIRRASRRRSSSIAT